MGVDKQKYNKTCKELKTPLEKDQNFKNKCLSQNLTATSATDYSLWKITKSLKNTVTCETPLPKPDHSWARNILLDIQGVMGS